MDAVTLTRQLVDIESITGNEAPVGNYLYGELCRLGYQTKKMLVEEDRFNVYATSPDHPEPAVVFSTHMDTVPPFITSSEDAGRIYGRGSCDAKGIIAAQIAAAERLAQRKYSRRIAVRRGRRARQPGRDSGERIRRDRIQARFLVNGEPTENHIALASKGTLRVEVTRNRTHGALGVSGTGRLSDRQADRGARAAARDAVAVRSGGRAVHAEYRSDRRRTRAQRDSRLCSRGLALPPGWAVGRSAPANHRDRWRSGARSHSRSSFPSSAFAPSTDLPTMIAEVHHRHPQARPTGASRC